MDQRRQPPGRRCADRLPAPALPRWSTSPSSTARTPRRSRRHHALWSDRRAPPAARAVAGAQRQGRRRRHRGARGPATSGWSSPTTTCGTTTRRCAAWSPAWTTVSWCAPRTCSPSWPWHARWDTGRTLLNRALSHDHPGTFGVRRSCFVAMGGYDGDVLFENLELTRTVRCAGGRVVDLPGVFVGRVPPGRRPLLVAAGAPGVRRPRAARAPAAGAVRAAHLAVWLGLGAGRARCSAGALAAVLLAEAGRRRAGARRPTRGPPPCGRCRGWGSGRSASGSRSPRCPGAVRRTAVGGSAGRPPRSAGCGPGSGGRSRGPDRSGADGVGVTPAVGQSSSVGVARRGRR